jgi:hypothetical protein
MRCSGRAKRTPLSAGVSAKGPHVLEYALLRESVSLEDSAYCRERFDGVRRSLRVWPLDRLRPCGNMVESRLRASADTFRRSLDLHMPRIHVGSNSVRANCNNAASPRASTVDGSCISIWPDLGCDCPQHSRLVDTLARTFSSRNSHASKGKELLQTDVRQQDHRRLPWISPRPCMCIGQHFPFAPPRGADDDSRQLVSVRCPYPVNNSSKR